MIKAKALLKLIADGFTVQEAVIIYRELKNAKTKIKAN